MQREDVVIARKNILNNALQRTGQVDKAAEYMEKNLEEAQKRVSDATEYQSKQNRDTIENNFDNLLVRMSQRGYFAQKGGYYNEGEYDTKPPFDVGFSAQVSVIEPKVIRVSGTWNVLPVGTRIRCILRDKSYPNAIPGGLKWDQGEVKLDPPKDLTFMQDQLFVKNQTFDRTIDMSRDPLMYPFTTDQYVVEFYYNPRQAPAYIQDKFGWSGEGLTDKNFLNSEIRPGTRVVYTMMSLTRDQLLRRGEWKERVPTERTKNFVGIGARNIGSDVIKVPGILSEPKQ